MIAYSVSDLRLDKVGWYRDPPIKWAGTETMQIIGHLNFVDALNI